MFEGNRRRVNVLDVCAVTRLIGGGEASSFHARFNLSNIGIVLIS